MFPNRNEDEARGTRTYLTYKNIFWKDDWKNMNLHCSLSFCVNRNYIVQTEEQYIFIYEAINEAIQSGQTEVLARNLLTHLQRLLQPINDSSLTEMELEFKVQEIFCIVI
jgi:hypothetical protein